MGSRKFPPLGAMIVPGLEGPTCHGILSFFSNGKHIFFFLEKETAVVPFESFNFLKNVVVTIKFLNSRKTQRSFFT